jgi:hypothetical protein
MYSIRSLLPTICDCSVLEKRQSTSNDLKGLNVESLTFCSTNLKTFFYFNFFLLSPFQTGHTALQRAASEGQLEVTKHLVGRGSAIDHQDEVVSTNSGFHHYGSSFDAIRCLTQAEFLDSFFEQSKADGFEQSMRPQAEQV